jgi:hypothetical protein
MNIKLEFNDEGVIYELMDIVVLAHLKNTREVLGKEVTTEVNGHDKEVYDALGVLIGYFGR